VVMVKQRYDVLLDARGLVCPIPLLKARQALMVVGRGATICILLDGKGTNSGIIQSAPWRLGSNPD
jgi:TusA-related sulfurtransferase